MASFIKKNPAFSQNSLELIMLKRDASVQPLLLPDHFKGDKQQPSVDEGVVAIFRKFFKKPIFSWTHPVLAKIISIKCHNMLENTQDYPNTPEQGEFRSTVVIPPFTNMPPIFVISEKGTLHLLHFGGPTGTYRFKNSSETFFKSEVDRGQMRPQKRPQEIFGHAIYHFGVFWVAESISAKLRGGSRRPPKYQCQNLSISVFEVAEIISSIHLAIWPMYAVITQ